MAVTEVPSNLADFAFPVGEFRAKRVANAGLPLAHLRSRYRRSLATPFLIVFAATPSFAANASKQAGHCGRPATETSQDAQVRLRRDPIRLLRHNLTRQQAESLSSGLVSWRRAKSSH